MLPVPEKLPDVEGNSISQGLRLCSLRLVPVFDRARRGSKDEAFEILKTYLGLEYEHKHKTIEAPAEQHSVHGEPQLQSAATERFDQLKAAEVEVPHQNNGYDCGLYMLKFIHLIAEHQPDFSDEETPRWASHPEIGFRRGEITELRRRMAKDIREMARLRVP